MIQRSFSYLTKTPLIVVFLILFFGVMGFATADFFSMGYPVRGTPFDAKVRSAGCFNLDFPSSETGDWGQKSIQDLFATARTFRYVSDGRSDKWQSADETESRYAGDCEDKAIWLFTRLINNGYFNVRLVIGRYRSIDSDLHVWVICSDKDGNTCLLDPAKQKRIWYLTAIDSGLYKPLYAYDGQNRYKYFSTNR